MGITPIGWFLIPLGIISFLVKPQWLYVLVLFFAPFSATLIIITGGGGSSSGISPYLFFGVLLLLRESAGVAFRMKVRILDAVHKPLLLLYLFGAVCLASLVMPLIINGRLEVMSDPSLNYRLVPLEYTRGMLNSSLSLVFDIAIATVIAYRNLDLKSFYRSLRIYLCSGVFISLWGLMQFIFYFLKLPYPAFIFNNSSTYNALGYLANLESGDIIKMSSVALESSFLCRVLAGMLAISVVSARGRTHIFQGRTEYLVSGLLFITILLATSSTGYVGVAVLLVMLLFIPSSSKMRNWKTRLLVLVIFTTMVISYFLISIVNSTLNTQLLNKNATGSAVERAVIIYNDLQYFLKYPVLGVGWNCVPTHDVIIGMLATCGLVGLFAFLLLIGTILYKLKQNIYIPAMQDTGDNPSIMMLLCLSVTCAVYVISGEITVPDFWIILGLSIAAVGIGHNLRHTMQAN